MEIESIQGKGLRVSMDYYLRLRRDTDVADFWYPECQDYLTDKLDPFLPRMAYDPIDNTVTAGLFQSTRGQEQEEMLHKSKPIDNSSNVPEKAYNELKKKIDELLREIDAEGIDPEKKRMVEAFALPDLQKSPELYRVYGKGKLAVLWGLEKNPGESIPLRKFCQDVRHAPGQWKKWLCVLLFVVVLGVGSSLYHCIACGGKGGDGTPDTHEGDSRGSGDTPAPKKGETELSGSPVSGPADQPATQETPVKSSGGDEKNAGKDGGDTQPPPADSTSVPQTEGGTAVTPGARESGDKKPAVDTGSGAPNVPVPEEVTSPQPEGGGSTATGTEGNSTVSAKNKIKQEVQMLPVRKNARVELPSRVVDFQVDVLSEKDVASGNVRVCVRVAVIEGANNAIEGGKIKGVPLDANHCAEVQIKGRKEELPYEIKLRNSKYPVTGGCKIKIETTK